MVMTPVDHAVIGAMSGTIEVCLMQPTVALKNAVQEGRSLPLTPGHLYRGLGMNVVSMAPITATQFGSNFAYNSLHEHITGRKTMAKSERLGTGFMAGATSALVANPTELVVIKQQQTGRSLGTEILDITRRLGVRAFGVGVYATMMREGIYGCCWMEVLPLIRGAIEESEFVQQRMPSQTPLLASGVASGILSATLSHPFDTIKTRMQAYIEPTHVLHPKYTSLLLATTNIVRDDGFLALFKGLAPRAFRITCAVFILNFCRSEIAPLYEQQKDSLLTAPV